VAQVVPLMVIADRAGAGVIEHGFRLGADEVIVKPLVPDDFLARLRRFIV
jgi:DNA-binding response OmpR family regulator